VITFLVVAGSIAGQLEDFGSKVFENGSKVDCLTRVSNHPSPNEKGPRTGSTSTNSLSIVALAEKTVDTANREGKTGLGGSRLGSFAGGSFSSRFSSRHDFVVLWIC
jgi:hypothetical protein